MKSDIEALRISMKSDITSLRSELKSDIAELKSEFTELKSDFNFRQNLLESKIDNLRWTMVAVGGIIVALIKFLP